MQSGYKGTSLVDYLKSVKKASDYSSRSKYATQYGIKDYKGSTSQNLQLLKKMRGF
ncbi:lyzozyme M1 [Listeria rocourtiae FSL F6-920]|nr:lyzozyme M1 [Listeria rocourtiae FSL F6-920]